MRRGLALLVALACHPVMADLPTAERQTALLDLLHQDCGSCHGMTLQGGLGPALLPPALERKSEATLIATILEGRPGTAMPPWKSFMTQPEAEWLVAQLKHPVKSEDKPH